MGRKGRSTIGRSKCFPTPRLSGAPTAGHQTWSGSTLCIFAGPRLASCRLRPLRSTVTPHNWESLHVQVAKQIHAIRALAYAQEANTLQIVDVAPFDQHHEDIQASNEYFLGAFKQDKLEGSVSFAPDDEPDQFLVTSLVVHPLHQREGTSRSLMVEALALTDGFATAVAAGAQNVPALSLYRDLGFVEYRSGIMGAKSLRPLKLRRTRSNPSLKRMSTKPAAAMLKRQAPKALR